MTVNEKIVVKNNGWVRHLILNDPESLNSLSEALATELFDRVREAESDDQVRAIVVTGAGKAFCAGGNLKDFMAVKEPLDVYINRVMRDLYNPLAMFISAMKTPVISAVNGMAIGAGVGLALNADIVVVSDRAFFSLPFVPRLGVVPDMGATWLVARGLGYNRALALVTTGDKLSAADAVAAGLVSECVEIEAFEERVQSLAESMAQLSNAAFQEARYALRLAGSNSFAEQLELERELQTRRFGSADFVEGLKAFAEKRSPDFVTIDNS